MLFYKYFFNMYYYPKIFTEPWYFCRKIHHLSLFLLLLNKPSMLNAYADKRPRIRFWLIHCYRGRLVLYSCSSATVGGWFHLRGVTWLFYVQTLSVFIRKFLCKTHPYALAIIFMPILVWCLAKRVPFQY